MQLKEFRSTLQISQSKLARISGVSRFKICTYELGDSTLTSDERVRVLEALQSEADRLRTLPVHLDFEALSEAPTHTPDRQGIVRHVTCRERD
jgi:predicted transcriptional regulator